MLNSDIIISNLTLYFDDSYKKQIFLETCKITEMFLFIYRMKSNVNID